jgi:hypothetical protein
MSSLSDRELVVYDAIIKKVYLKRYKLAPDQVDKLSVKHMVAWGKMTEAEVEKGKTSGT